MGKINCCRFCIPPKRCVGCHATCPEYIQERADLDQINAERQKFRNIKQGIKEQKNRVIDTAIRNKRDRQRRRR